MDSFFPTIKIYNPHGQNYTLGRRELMLAYKESDAGPDPAPRHQRGRLGGGVHRGRHVLRHARRADDPDLRLLLDVRLPAHRRLDLGGRRPDGPRLPHRRHRRPHDADRRGPAARRRPLARCSPRPTRRSCHYDPAYGYEIAHIVQDGLRRMYGDSTPDRTSSTTSRSTTSRSSQPSRARGRRRRGHPARHVPARAGAHRGLDDDAAAGAAARVRRRRAVGARGPAAAAPTTGASRPTSGR